ncbi:MAG: hypothetical protein ACFFFH_13495 [Candidatus Thorarchaeota archaeon]
MIEGILSYIKEKGGNFSFYQIKKDLNLSEGQLDIIKLQLLHLGLIEEIKHYEGEDELNPVTCRGCPQKENCIEKDPLSIKVYRLTSKALARH